MDPVSTVYIPEIHSVSILLWKLNVMHFINIFPQFITLNLWQACGYTMNGLKIEDGPALMVFRVYTNLGC